MTPAPAPSGLGELVASVHNAIQQVSEVYGRLIAQLMIENSSLRAQLAIRTQERDAHAQLRDQERAEKKDADAKAAYASAARGEP